MKHYEKLLALGCVTRSQLEQVTGSPSAADWLCREYQRKGYMERIKRNLYAVISLETGQCVANRYQIASHISDDAVDSYHSAFEYYGYANQVFYEVQVTSVSRFRAFNYDGITYRHIGRRIEDGVLENPKVDAALAYHVAAGKMPVGIYMYNDNGTMMYSVDGFQIDIKGKGSHGRYRPDCCDRARTAFFK